MPSDRVRDVDFVFYPTSSTQIKNHMSEDLLTSAGCGSLWWVRGVQYYMGGTSSYCMYLNSNSNLIVLVS